MSKAYIFVNHCVSGVAGGQRYVHSKARWLLERGWEVAVCHVSNGPIVLDFEGIEIFDIPDLGAVPRILGDKRVCKAISGLMSKFEGATELIVESSAPYLGFWGEEIARRLKGRHLCFDLEEVAKPEDQSFIGFKYRRHELASINPRIAACLIAGSAHEPGDYSDCVLRAWNPSPFEEIENEIPIPNVDFKIGCITRLEKPYVADMMRGVVSFCNNFPSASVAMVLIGDGSNPSFKNRIESTQDKVPNLQVIVTGFMSPIPLSLVKSFDLCIGKAGAAANCAMVGIPTIAYSLDTDELLGLLAYEVPRTNSSAEEVPKCRKIEDLIERVLVKREWDGVEPLYQYPPRKPVDYSDHLAFLNKSLPHEYYDQRIIHPSGRRILISLWIKLFKNAKYERMLHLVSRRA